MRNWKFYFVFLLALLLVPGLALAATSVGNAVSVGDTLGVTGATTLDGAVTLGNATNDDITVTGYIASNILPKTNDAYDLGAFAKAYNDVFASGSIYLAGITALPGGAITIATTTSNVTINGRLAAALKPNANNTINLGAYTLAYHNVFASGTVYSDSLYVGAITATSTVTITSNLTVDTNTLLVDASANKVGVVSTTPFAQLSVGAGGAGKAAPTSTIATGRFCMYAGQEDGTNVYVYMPLDAEAGEPFATTTVACGTF